MIFSVINKITILSISQSVNVKPILNECPHKMEVLKSVDREESCLFIFIMLSVIMQMLSSLLFTVPTSQSEINLHFLCFAHQRISSALATV